MESTKSTRPAGGQTASAPGAGREGCPVKKPPSQRPERQPDVSGPTERWVTLDARQSRRWLELYGHTLDDDPEYRWLKRFGLLDPDSPITLLDPPDWLLGKLSGGPEPPPSREDTTAATQSSQASGTVNRPVVKPRSLADLAISIRAKNPRGGKVPKLLKLIDEKIKDRDEVEINFDDIRERCHDERDVYDDAVEDTIEKARREIMKVELPYTLSKNGCDLIVVRHLS
jgi:hypothetical protein